MLAVSMQVEATLLADDATKLAHALSHIEESGHCAIIDGGRWVLGGLKKLLSAVRKGLAQLKFLRAPIDFVARQLRRAKMALVRLASIAKNKFMAMIGHQAAGAARAIAGFLKRAPFKAFEVIKEKAVALGKLATGKLSELTDALMLFVESIPER